mgnify:CR=1 FL=1
MAYSMLKTGGSNKGVLPGVQKNIQQDVRDRMQSMLPMLSGGSPLGLPLFDGEGGLVSDLNGGGYLPMTQMFPFYSPEHSMNLGYS